MRKKLSTPVGHDCRDMSALKSARKNDRGFSLLELCVVVAILMIVAGMVFINAVTAVHNIRLTQSATSYANLLQQARIRAVLDDTYYTVITDPATDPPMAFVDLVKNQTYAPADPMAIFLQDVTPMAFGSGPGRTDLISKFLPTSGSGTVDSGDPGPTFGPRGLPCKPSAPSGGTCSSMTPTSYITFLQNAQSAKWEAVTVTPAGRIGIWSYDGTTWSPLN
jgi:prepilin-type N-terminal cleavage/methylation domain-containing protein